MEVDSIDCIELIVIKLLTQLNCVDALPLAPMSSHMQANRMTHLTPYEMHMGRPMPSHTFRGPSVRAIRSRIKNNMFDD